MAYEISLDDGKTVAYTAETSKQLVELIYKIFESSENLEYISIRQAETIEDDKFITYKERDTL